MGSSNNVTAAIGSYYYTQARSRDRVLGCCGVRGGAWCMMESPLQPCTTPSWGCVFTRSTACRVSVQIEPVEGGGARRRAIREHAPDIPVAWLSLVPGGPYHPPTRPWLYSF